MDERFFVSYSTVDAADFALRLADDLAAGPPAYPVWVDMRSLRPGDDWDEQIVEALRTCRGLLFVLTEDSVGPESVCKQEWARALKYKKPVIPLRLHPMQSCRFGSDPASSSTSAATTTVRWRDYDNTWHGLAPPLGYSRSFGLA